MRPDPQIMAPFEIAHYVCVKFKIVILPTYG